MTLTLLLLAATLAAGNPEDAEGSRTRANEKEEEVNAEYRHSDPEWAAAPIDKKSYKTTRIAAFAAG